MKRKILFLLFIFSSMIGSAVCGQVPLNLSSNHGTNQVTNRHITLQPQQLFDTAFHYYRQNDIDKALFYFGLLTGLAPHHTDTAKQKLVITAYILSANIYYQLSRYRTAYELLLIALQHAERSGDIISQSRVYLSLGLIYHTIGKQDVAIKYFSEALKLGRDSALILNNIGYVNVLSGNLDDAFYVLSQSLQLANEKDSRHLYLVLHSFAMYYRAREIWDSAYHFYRLSLAEAMRESSRQHKRVQAIALSGLGQLYFELNKPDSALFYINQSNLVAIENDLLGVRMENYLILSNIATRRRQGVVAFEYFRRYYDLKNSVLNSVTIAEIGELRRRQESSKASQQISQLTVEQQVKAQTIRYQRILRNIILAVLLLISAILTFVLTQHRRLNTAYKKLFDKSVKLVEYENMHVKEGRKTILTDKVPDKLIAQIYAVMEDTTVVCDPEFTLDKLADLVGSNRVLVSQAINNGLKKNFRTFINEYRVREAQRLFSESETIKYTIEYVAINVGFKSRTSFITAFKETTGVSPGFYLRALRKSLGVSV